MKQKAFIVLDDADGLGELQLYKAKDVKDLILNKLDYKDQRDEEVDGEDISVTDLIYEFEMWCGENNQRVLVFDLQKKKQIIGSN